MARGCDLHPLYFSLCLAATKGDDATADLPLFDAPNRTWLSQQRTRQCRPARPSCPSIARRRRWRTRDFFVGKDNCSASRGPSSHVAVWPIVSTVLNPVMCACLRNVSPVGQFARMVTVVTCRDMAINGAQYVMGSYTLWLLFAALLVLLSASQQQPINSTVAATNCEWGLTPFDSSQAQIVVIPSRHCPHCTVQRLASTVQQGGTILWRRKGKAKPEATWFVRHLELWLCQQCQLCHLHGYRLVRFFEEDRYGCSERMSVGRVPRF